MDGKNKYRVFISYSHADAYIAEKVIEHLRSIGIEPMSDHLISGGAKFSEEIRWQISCSHVFVSILTDESSQSTWVISELGYAIGVGTPVFPLSFGKLPEGLANELHAVTVKPDLSDLDRKLTYHEIENRIMRSRDEGKAVYECVDTLRERTELLVSESKKLHLQAGPQRVRQRMAFSSFSIPDAPPRSSVFNQRDGRNQHNEEERKLLRMERQVMEKHANGAGCDLVLDLYVLVHDVKTKQDTVQLKHSPEMTLVRLKILRDFISDFPSDDIRIAFNRGQISGSRTMLGNWLTADAVVPHYKSGYRQTIVTRHAPTLLAKIEEFDEELNDCLLLANVKPEDSRQYALDEIDTLIEKL